MFGDKKSGFARVANKIKSDGSHCMPNNEAFEGKLVQVIECNDQGDCLCLGEGDNPHMASIDHTDIVLFIPINKSMGNFLVPSGMSSMQSINWSSLVHEFPNIYNAAVITFANINDRIPTYADFRELHKMCDDPSKETIEMCHLINTWMAIKKYAKA